MLVPKGRQGHNFKFSFPLFSSQQSIFSFFLLSVSVQFLFLDVLWTLGVFRSDLHCKSCTFLKAWYVFFCFYMYTDNKKRVYFSMFSTFFAVSHEPVIPDSRTVPRRQRFQQRILSLSWQCLLSSDLSDVLRLTFLYVCYLLMNSGLTNSERWSL